MQTVKLAGMFRTWLRMLTEAYHRSFEINHPTHVVAAGSSRHYERGFSAIEQFRVLAECSIFFGMIRCRRQMRDTIFWKQAELGSLSVVDFNQIALLDVTAGCPVRQSTTWKGRKAVRWAASQPVYAHSPF